MDLPLIARIAIGVVVVLVALLLLRLVFKLFGKVAKFVIIALLVAAVAWLLLSPNGVLHSFGLLQAIPLPFAHLI